MKNYKILVAVAGVLASVEFADAQQRAHIRQVTNPVSNQYIVVLKPRPGVTSSAAVSRIARSLISNYSSAGRLRQTYHAVYPGFSANMRPDEARALANNPRVDFVEQDGKVRASSIPQWNLDRINQINLPLDRNYAPSSNGRNVHAYVLDTGIRSTHGEFGGRVSLDFSAISDRYGASDCNGHGTHVAGTLGGATYGVAKQVNLHSVRVLDCSGGGTFSGVIAGVDFVTQKAKRPAVANMSLGGGISQSLDLAVKRSIASGIAYAVAAGNDGGKNACGVSPARVPGALTTGSTNITDMRSSFSNIGECVDVFAPGERVKSAWHTRDTATRTLSGTSMAAPHVAGAAAQYLQRHRSASPAEIANALVAHSNPKVRNPGTRSPNRLLSNRFTDQVRVTWNNPCPNRHTSFTLRVQDETGGQSEVVSAKTGVRQYESPTRAGTKAYTYSLTYSCLVNGDYGEWAGWSGWTPVLHAGGPTAANISR